MARPTHSSTSYRTERGTAGSRRCPSCRSPPGLRQRGMPMREPLPFGSDEEWEAWLDYARLYGPHYQTLERLRERGGLTRGEAPLLRADVERTRQRGGYLYDVSKEVRR